MLIGLACALLAGAPALAGKPDPAEGNFETLEAVDGARFGGPPGLATVRLLLQPKHAGIVVVLPTGGSDQVTLPVAWRYSARKQTLNLRIGKLKLAAVFVRGDDGHAVFAGRSWRNMDLPLATAPQPSPAPSPAPTAAPEPSPTTAPAPSPAPSPSPTAAPRPSPPGDRPPLMAPAPDPEPSPAPSPLPAPSPASPAPSPSPAAPAPPPSPAAPAPLPLPTLPPSPRLPSAPSSSPLAGLWLSSLGRDYIWFIDLAADGSARMGLLRGNRVVATQAGSWSAPSSASHLTLTLPSQTLAGPARTMLTATTGTTLAWSGARWRRP